MIDFLFVSGRSFPPRVPNAPSHAENVAQRKADWENRLREIINPTHPVFTKDSKNK